MSIPTPFTTNFPLKSTPFNSRIESQIDSSKNYYIVGFKPGFPLQASELNELQEIFYIQQTLTQTCFANWGIKEYKEQSYGNMSPTPWNGSTPLNAPQVTANVGTGSSLDLVFNPGWYLLKQDDFNGGMGVWVYVSTSSSPLTQFKTSSPGNVSGDYGIIVKTTTINCTKSSPAGQNEDRSLQDSSNINVINGPCGAARLKIEVVGFGKSGSETSNETFLPIVTAENNGSFVRILYKNGYILGQV